MKKRLTATGVALGLVLGAGCNRVQETQPEPSPPPPQPISQCEATNPKTWRPLAQSLRSFSSSQIARTLGTAEVAVTHGSWGVVNCSPSIPPEQTANYTTVVVVKTVPETLGNLCVATGIASEQPRQGQDVEVICPLKS